jgi:hypothetical protein
MQKDTKTLIEELLSITESASKAVEKFKRLAAGQLNFKRDPAGGVSSSVLSI